jgi:hypothetical protein
VHLERVVHEVHDPVLTQPGLRIERRLEATIEAQARVGDLDHERGRRGMRREIVLWFPGDDRDVRLRLRVLPERERGVQARVPRTAERRREEPPDFRGDRGVGAALGLPDHEHAIEQLQMLAHEHAEIDQPLVLDAAPAPGRCFPLECRSHGATVPTVERGRQRPHPDTC